MENRSWSEVALGGPQILLPISHPRGSRRDKSHPFIEWNLKENEGSGQRQVSALKSKGSEFRERSLIFIE